MTTAFHVDSYIRAAKCIYSKIDPVVLSCMRFIVRGSVSTGVISVDEFWRTYCRFIPDLFIGVIRGVQIGWALGVPLESRSSVQALWEFMLESAIKEIGQRPYKVMEGWIPPGYLSHEVARRFV